MRLVLIIYDSLDSLSGGYLYDRKLVEQFRNQGDSVEVISIPRKRYWPTVLRNGRDLPRYLVAAEKVDLVLQDELVHPSLFRANSRLSATAAPIVSIVHHLRADEKKQPADSRAGRWIERRYLRSVDGFIFNSHQTRTAVETLSGRQPSVICYPGKDHISPTVTPEAIEV